MKKLILSFFSGALVALLIILIILPLYSDYRSRAETEFILEQIRPLQKQIEGQIIKNNVASLVDVSIKNLDSSKNLYVQISNSGWIVIKSKRFGQIIVLIPSLSKNNVDWKCYVSPNQARVKMCS